MLQRRGARVDLSLGDRRALGAWLWTRVGTYVAVTVAATLLASGGAPGLLERWRRWDVVHYQAIAAGGYDQTGPTPYAAFFPGLPALLRLLSGLGIDLTLAGLLVSAVASASAVVALSRLAATEGPAESGDRAVLLLLLSPAAVFLAAGYSEALFLGLALPAWLAARRGQWWWAGLLAAGAATTRVTGLFLALALVVEWATRVRDRRASDLGALALPFAAPLAFAVYLHSVTGDWLAYVHAQRKGWYRQLTDPVTAWQRTWDAAFGTRQLLEYRVMFRAELVALVAGVLLTAWLLWDRRWGEATYVGMQVMVLATSTWYFSVPRATLLWWPLWLLLGRATARRRWLLAAYLALVAPVAVLWAAAFTTVRWAG